MKRKQLTLCAALIVALSIGGSAWAAENVAATSGLWSNAVIWSEGHVPTTADDLAKVWGQATVTVDYAAPDVSGLRLGSLNSHRGKVVIDSGASLRNQGILEISGGHTTSGMSRLNVSGTLVNDGAMRIGHVNGASAPGGALQVATGGSITANGGVNIGYGANGQVEVLGGTFTQTGTGDTYVGSGFGVTGTLLMDGGAYYVGDDLILGSGGNGRTGELDLGGGALLDINDALFGGLGTAYTACSAEILVSDAEINVGTYMYLGRNQTGTMTLDHADADVNAWGLQLGTAGTGDISLLDGVLTIRGNSTADTLLTIGAGGSIEFEKGELAYNDNTTEDELEGWWADGTFTATKNGGKALSFTNTLDSISYTKDLGDGYTAVVGLDGGVAKTFVTIPEPATIGLLGMSSSILILVRRRLLL